MEATYISMDRGMDKEDVVHIYTIEYCSAIKRMKYCSNINGPRDYPSK